MQTKLSQIEIDKLNLNGTIGSKVLFFDELTSTFDKIRTLLLTDGLTVACAHQTEGSGRLGRTWESPRGGVYFTFALLPPFNGFEIPFITLVCALGVQKALSSYADCLIKWPNDIVSDGKKLCGILTKNIAAEGKISAVLVGIGINANNTDFPGGLYHADSLKRITGDEINENILLRDVLSEINNVYTLLCPHEILARYKKKCVNLGKEVTIHYIDNRGDIHGICTDILPDGSLNVETPDGLINVHSGEVSVKGIYECENPSDK